MITPPMVEWGNSHPGSLPTLCPDAGDRLHHPSFLIFPHFFPFSSIFPYPPPHFPPLSPIFRCHGYTVGTFLGAVPATGAGYFSALLANTKRDSQKGRGIRNSIITNY